jgi:hypothetical protein
MLSQPPLREQPRDHEWQIMIFMNRSAGSSR